jgi:hypothetical protein
MTLVRTAPTAFVKKAVDTAPEIATPADAVPEIITAEPEAERLISQAAAHGPSAFTWLREFLRLQSAAPVRGRLARLFGKDPLAKGAERAYAGALAELEVADVIAALGDEWIVLDGAGAGGREFALRGDSAVCADRILVGPPGVFTVTLRNHFDDKVWVGERTFVVGSARFPHIRDAEFEADRVSETIGSVLDTPIAVTPCLVIADPAELVVRDRPRRTEVLVPQDFGVWLHGLPRILSPAALADYSAIARVNWPERLPLTAGAGSAFLGVHGQVVAARSRRLFWAAIGALVVCGILILTTSGLVAAQQLGY